MRAKLLSKDRNEIDSIFLDKRNLELNGSTLVGVTIIIGTTFFTDFPFALVVIICI